MGASENMCMIRSLVAALCFHQFFKGMGLGGCILQAGYEMKMKGILVFLFLVTTPLGVAFGLLLSNTKKIDWLHWWWSKYSMQLMSGVDDGRDDEEKIKVQLEENAITK
nr:Fe(2+) transport protein 1-like [Tanacetum cinerariifolium]